MLLSFFVLVFFSLALSVLSLSLYWFRSSVFFSSSSVFVRLCLFSDLLFKRGGDRYTWRQSWCSCVGWPVLSSLCLCFFLRLLSDLPSLGLVFFFVLLFSCVCSSSLSPSVCIVHSMCSVCSLCVCPLFLFLFILWLPSVYPRGPFCFLSLCFRSSHGLPPLVVAFLWLYAMR